MCTNRVDYPVRSLSILFYYNFSIRIEKIIIQLKFYLLAKILCKKYINLTYKCQVSFKLQIFSYNLLTLQFTLIILNSYENIYIFLYCDLFN